jgi:hypothetical protein
MTPDEKLQESIVVMRAAADRDIARSERDSLRVEVMALRATLRLVCAWCEAHEYDKQMSDALIEQILVTMEMSEQEVVTE